MQDSASMRKLNQRKIRWIIREMEKGERSVYRIAKLQNVTPRWVRELYRRYTETGEYPYPNKPGRK
ncbi:MAG TPA: IS481 family transposase, partial [Candidatus Atribacteria bacterium]|nr:IS481 family transposase [Candidatus Atribacteria bacterium]